MKKTIVFLLVILLVTSLSSCTRQRRAYEMLNEFISAYGAEGVIYSADIPEWESGYITDGLIEKIYTFSGDFPDNFAVFLNSHTDYGSECGVFVCTDADMAERMEECATLRVRLLGRGGDKAFVIRSGNTVFYSTMTDKKRAKEIWHEIIKT